MGYEFITNSFNFWTKLPVNYNYVLKLKLHLVDSTFTALYSGDNYDILIG